MPLQLHPALPLDPPLRCMPPPPPVQCCPANTPCAVHLLDPLLKFRKPQEELLIVGILSKLLHSALVAGAGSRHVTPALHLKLGVPHPRLDCRQQYKWG